MLRKVHKRSRENGVPLNPEITVTRETDLAYLQKEFGIDVLMQYGADELMSHSDEIWERFELYLELVIAQGVNFEKAVVGDSPDDWKEANQD